MGVPLKMSLLVVLGGGKRGGHYLKGRRVLAYHMDPESLMKKLCRPEHMVLRPQNFYWESLLYHSGPRPTHTLLVTWVLGRLEGLFRPFSKRV